MKAILIKVRALKMSQEEIKKRINNGTLIYSCNCLDKKSKRFMNVVYRYVGDDDEKIGLYFDDLVIEE